MASVAVVGAGRIGRHHARMVAGGEVSGLELTVLADPLAPDLEGLAGELGVGRTVRDPLELAGDEWTDWKFSDSWK